MTDIILSYPPSYALAILLMLALSIETALRFKSPWRISYAVVLGTVATWYLIEPIYSSSQFVLFDSQDVSDAFFGVIIFLVAFRLFAQLFAPRDAGADGVAGGLKLTPETAQQLLFASIAMWIVLVVIGVWRVDGNIIEALFPNGRAETAAMWGRSGVASGIGDTFASLAGYLYLVVLANFGVMLVFIKRPALRILCLVLIAISWPYAFLSGARTLALAVFTPGFLAFILYGRISPAWKIIISVVAFIIINQAFKIIIAYRNLGWDHYGDVDMATVHHDGLNMASELTNVIGFLRDGSLTLQWGYGYLADICQVVPRALWPDKPTIGFDYAMVRGFRSATDADAVTVTISTGMIGGGVRQFGSIFGPIAVAFIMAIWVRILTQLRAMPQTSRTCLFLLGLGLTFNLGRDISLLVLWPFVLAWVAVLGFERLTARRRKNEFQLSLR